MKKFFYTWEQFDEDINDIIRMFKRIKPRYSAIYGIPKGGLVLATTLANKLKIPLYLGLNTIPKHISKKNILIVDDVSDTGKTLLKIPKVDDYDTLTLFYKPQSKFIPNYYCRDCEDNEWIVYPWE